MSHPSKLNLIAWSKLFCLATPLGGSIGAFFGSLLLGFWLSSHRSAVGPVLERRWTLPVPEAGGLLLMLGRRDVGALPLMLGRREVRVLPLMLGRRDDDEPPLMLGRRDRRCSSGDTLLACFPLTLGRRECRPCASGDALLACLPLTLGRRECRLSTRSSSSPPFSMFTSMSSYPYSGSEVLMDGRRWHEDEPLTLGRRDRLPEPCDEPDSVLESPFRMLLRRGLLCRDPRLSDCSIRWSPYPYWLSLSLPLSVSLSLLPLLPDS